MDLINRQIWRFLMKSGPAYEPEKDARMCHRSGDANPTNYALRSGPYCPRLCPPRKWSRWVFSSCWYAQTLSEEISRSIAGAELDHSGIVQVATENQLGDAASQICV